MCLLLGGDVDTVLMLGQYALLLCLLLPPLVYNMEELIDNCFDSETQQPARSSEKQVRVLTHLAT